MRLGLWALPLTLLLGVSSAWAQDDDPDEDSDAEKGADEEDGESSSGMMEDTGRDPAETETWDDKGRFVPKKKEKPKPVVTKDDKEEEKDEPIDVKPTKGVFLEALIGFGKAPIPGPAGSATALTPDGTSYGFLLGGHYDVSEKIRLQLRVPWTTVAFEDRSDSALGVPEIAGRMVLGEPKALTMSVRVAVGIPIGQGDADPTNGSDPVAQQQGYVNRFASAANGWRDPELYELKRLPVTPAFVMRYQRERLQAGAEAKIVFLPKIGGEIRDPMPIIGAGTYELNSLGIFGFAGGDLAYDVLGEKYVGLRGWLVWRALEPIDFESGATTPSPFQFVLEPRIFAKFGVFTPSIGFLIPLGGRLGGEINGLRLHANFVF